MALQEAGLPIKRYEAETHRLASERLANQPFQITPGGALVSREGKVLFQSSLKPENTAGLWNDWFKMSHGTDAFGNPGPFDPIKASWSYNMMFKNQPDFKPIGIKDFDRSMVAPFIHQYIQQHPKTSGLKPDSKKYQELFQETLKELYKK